MSKKYWNTVILDGNIRWNDLKEWIDHSYDEVVQGLKKSERDKIK
jgi:predicted DNA-binding protein (MmcQ/YjbR family)